MGKLYDAILVLAHQQGWSDTTVIHLLCQYVERENLPDDLMGFLQQEIESSFELQIDEG